MSENTYLRARLLISTAIIVFMAVPAMPAGALSGPEGDIAAPRVTDDASKLVVGSGETYELSGCHTYTQSVQIDGILKVKPYDGSDPTSGTITLVAPSITMGASGAIAADGRGFGGGGGASEITGMGGKGGTAGKGGNGDAAGYWGAGGGGGSNGGLGGAGASYGTPGSPGTETGGGKGGDSTIVSYRGSPGGTGFGGGGGGGAGWVPDGGGGGGGGSGGTSGSGYTTGGNGAGTAAGKGSTSSAGKGGDGGYAAAGTNGDSSTDMSVLKGSGGGGGASGSYYGGAGGGGAGGGSVALISSGDITIGGKISTSGGGGGIGGYDSSGKGGDGGGGAGGGILLSGLQVTVSGTLDARGRTGDTLSTTNGGTIKLFFDTDGTGSGSIQAGRIYRNGRPRMQGLTAPENDGTALVRAEFSWKAATDPEGDSVSYHIQVSDSSTFPTTVINREGLTDTEYTSDTDLIGTEFYWRVRARDAVGYGAWTPAWKFLTDVTPPESHVNPLPVYSTKINFTVSWTGTDDSSGVDRYDIFVAEGTGALTYLPWLENYDKTSAVFEGRDGVKYSFYSVATDRGRNREADPLEADASITVDATPPVTTMKALTAYQGSLRFPLSWTGKDATSGIQYYNVFMAEGDADFELLSEHILKSPLDIDAEDGQDYKFYVIGCDYAGNWEAVPPANRMVKTRVDLTPPEVTMRLGNPNFGLEPVYITAATNMYLDSSDNFAGVCGTYYNIDGRGAKLYANSVKESSAGPHNMTYWATDKAGNKCEDATFWFVVDSQAPETVLSCEGASRISGGRVYIVPSTQVILSSLDGASGVNYIEYNLDKRAYTRYSVPLKFPSGSHSLSFRAVDKVGNIEAEQTVSLIVDAMAPVTRTDGDFSTISKEDITFGLVATDGESGVQTTYFRILREKDRTGDFQPGTSVTVEASQGDGNYTIQYYSVDYVGNNEKTKELKVRIDTQVALQMAVSGIPAVDTSKYLIEGKTEPGARIMIGIDSVQVSADGSFAQEVDLKPGKNKFVLDITDMAGNTRQQTVNVIYNQPVAAADWFLPLIVMIVIAVLVGAGAYMYRRGRKGGMPPARAPPPRGPPQRVPQRPPVPPARTPQGRMPPPRAPQGWPPQSRAPPPVPPRRP